MRDEERLNQGHSQIRGTLRVIGPLVVLTGAVFMAIGLISFFSSFGTFAPPKYFWCCFVGIPLLGVGLMITKFAYMGAVLRFVAGESAPVAKDTINYMADGTRGAVRTVAGAIREGFSGEEPSAARCPKCGSDNDAGAKFCDQCGANLPAITACGNCGEKNEPDARFCNNCGDSLR